jgi:tetratricopeptide (TPR) repeat protein
MEEAEKLHARIITLLDTGKPLEAKTLIEEKYAIFKKYPNQDLFVILEIACSHISIGQDLRDGDFAKIGLDILLNYKSQFEKALTPQSLHYNIGNGYQAIYDSSFVDGMDKFPNAEEVKGDLAMAKEHFWKSYKEIDLTQLDGSSIMLLTNLGNNLIMAGRIVEALQLFDSVLHFDPAFVNAQASKAETLKWHTKVSDIPITISLFAEMYRLYKSATERSVWLKERTDQLTAGKNYFEQFLTDQNVEISELDKEFAQNQIEFENHSHEERFYLTNFFNLSEHGLYCFCNGATPDKLTIGSPELVTFDKVVIEMEFTLNQLKSEFSLARRLFYEYKEGGEDSMHFERISENYISGIVAERLRTAFRLCFGVLDKIANGICTLYDLNCENENVYFESFWKKSKSCPRWARINEIRNIHLTALYSMACDLNTKAGELKQYKEWRNALEHKTFTLTNEQKSDEKMTFLLKSFSTIQDFEFKTKHLIQLTRAAIFSFVYCVRTERLKK